MRQKLHFRLIVLHKYGKLMKVPKFQQNSHDVLHVSAIFDCDGRLMPSLAIEASGKAQESHRSFAES